MEKANGDRDGEEELDEFELEKRAIGLKIKEAIESDETAEAVKALMAVAKEHELQCAAPRRPAPPPRRHPCPRRRRARHAALRCLCCLRCRACCAPSARPLCRCDDLFGFIFECVLDANALKQVSTHKAVLAKLFKSSGDKKKTQKFMLECVQKLVTDSPHASALLSKTPNLLKALYDIDLLEEDILIKWHEKGSKKKARRPPRPRPHPNPRPHRSTHASLALPAPPPPPLPRAGGQEGARRRRALHQLAQGG